MGYSLRVSSFHYRSDSYGFSGKQGCESACCDRVGRLFGYFTQMNSLSAWLKKLTLGQWVAIITVVIGISTYIGTREKEFSDAKEKAQQEHDETIKQRLANARWKDSVNNVLKIHDYRMAEIERKQQEKKERDDAQEDVEEARMDQIEKDLIINKTEFHDYKEFHHK